MPDLRKIRTVKQASVGLKNFLRAKMSKAEDGTVSFGEVERFAVAQKATMSIDTTIKKEYGDDGECDTITTFEGGKLNLQMYGIDNVSLAEFKGQTRDANGITIGSDTDEPQAYAIGYQFDKRDDSTTFRWIYNCILKNDNDEQETKGEKTAPKSKSLEFEIGTIPKIIGKGNNYEVEVNTLDEEISKDIKDTFLKEVYVGTLPTA